MVEETETLEPTPVTLVVEPAAEPAQPAATLEVRRHRAEHPHPTPQEAPASAAEGLRPMRQLRQVGLLRLEVLTADLA